MRKSLVLLLASLLLVVVLLIILFYITTEREKEKRETRTRTDVLNDLQDTLKTKEENVAAAATAAGIDPEDLKKELFNKTCALLPIDGKCTTGFELNDGCCEIPNDIDEINKNEYNARVSKLLKQIGVSMVAEVLLTDILPRVIKNGKYISKLSRLLPKSTKLTSKLTARVVAKIALRIAQKLAIRAAMLSLKLLSKLGAGPVGWALMVFDILSAVADIGDGGNYDSFISNDNLIKMRNQSIYKLWEARRKEGNDLPTLFPFIFLFPKESEEAERVTSEMFMNEAIKILASKDEYQDLLVDLIIIGFSEETDQPVDTIPPDDKKLDDTMTKISDITRQAKGKELDEKMYKELVRIIKNRTKEEKSKSIYDENDIVLLPILSSTSEIGISVTKKGADKWNTQKEPMWFEYNDPYFPKPEPDDYIPPLYASYSNKYYTIDINKPGTLSNPNVIKKSAPTAATFVYPFGALFTLCEKTRTSAKYKKPINPRDYGVYLDNETGICNYTKDYCKRYGIDHKSQTTYSGETYYDCKLSKDQEALEFIFGTTFTRGSKKVWQDRIDDFNSGDPGKIALATAMTIVDPAGAQEVMTQQKHENYVKNKEKHGAITAALIMGADFTGMVQPFIENMDEKLDGRTKFCETGDECKQFHAKSRGGNTMSWSVRNKDGDIYSKGQAFQNEVKVGEDHTFYIPKDGYFKVSCFGVGGEKKNFSYDEVSNPFRVSCFFGKIDTSDRSTTDVFFAKAGSGIAEVGGNIAEGAGIVGESFVEGGGIAGETLIEGGETLIEGGKTVLEEVSNSPLNPKNWKL